MTGRGSAIDPPALPDRFKVLPQPWRFGPTPLGARIAGPVVPGLAPGPPVVARPREAAPRDPVNAPQPRADRGLPGGAECFFEDIASRVTQPAGPRITALGRTHSRFPERCGSPGRPERVGQGAGDAKWPGR